MANTDAGVELEGLSEVVAVSDAWLAELDRLSREDSPEARRALDKLLDMHGHVVRSHYAHNLVTFEGANADGAAVLANGTWFVGLKGTGVEARADTAASHAGWAEVTNYTQTARQPLVLGTWASGAANNSANRAIFTAPTGGMNVYGWFVANNSAKGATSGRIRSVVSYAVQAVAVGQALRQTINAAG